jgi:hypothetical protein
MTTMTQNSLMENLAKATESIQDPVLRSRAGRLLQDMDEITTEVLQVGQTRDELPQLRARLEEGGAALVVDRGVVRNAQETTVMLSLETLYRLIFSIIRRSTQMQLERTSPAELLTGLSPVPAARDFALDFANIAKGQPDNATTNIEF